MSFSAPQKGESNYEIEFDPVVHHNEFCPWVNGNVAAAGGTSSGSTNADAVALNGWQLTLDAIDALQSLGRSGVQTLQSESAASLYKVGFFLNIFFLSTNHFIYSKMKAGFVSLL